MTTVSVVDTIYTLSPKSDQPVCFLVLEPLVGSEYLPMWMDGLSHMTLGESPTRLSPAKAACLGSSSGSAGEKKGTLKTSGRHDTCPRVHAKTVLV